MKQVIKVTVIVKNTQHVLTARNLIGAVRAIGVAITARRRIYALSIVAAELRAGAGHNIGRLSAVLLVRTVAAVLIAIALGVTRNAVTIATTELIGSATWSRVN